MESKELYRGEILTEGPFSMTGFWNLMRILFIEKALEQESPSPLDIESIIGADGNPVFYSNTWHIKGDVKVEYIFNAYPPYLKDKKPHMSATIQGPKEKIGEVEKKINQAIQEGKYQIN